MNPVTTAIGYFPDPLIGKPISEGYIYVGEPDTDPTVPANQKTMTVLEEDGSLTVVSQPLRTNAGGTPTYNGSPVTLMVEIPFSISVLRKTLTQAYYVPTVNTGDLIGDVKAVDGTTVLDSGTDGTDAVFTGDVTGDITGNVTGDLTGNVTGDLTGNVTGNVAGDLTGTVTATSTIADGVVATTQTAGDNSTKVATTEYIDSAVSGLAGSETFAASGTFSVPAGVGKIFVDAVAGGGGGATGVPPTTGGGGGASGESVYGLILTVTPLANIAVTIGAGGAPAATGGVTSLGSLISLAGGGPGVTTSGGSTASQNPAFSFSGGAGGNGVDGVSGSASAFFSGGTGGALFGGVEGGGGGGGASCHGAGANGGAGNAAGASAGANTGAGGGGGGSDGLGKVGGSGGSGYMIIRW